MISIWRTDPRLAMEIDRIFEEIPTIEPAKDGNFTIRVPSFDKKSPKTDAGIYLHSRYRPKQEADAWADSQKCTDRYAVVVSGFGLGYHIQALFDRMPEDALLVVAEPNLPVLKAALQTLDLADALATGRIMIFTSLDRANLVERLEPRSVLLTAGAGLGFAQHPASVQAARDFHAAFAKLITEFVAFTRTGFLTLMLNNVTTCRNIANNLGRYATTQPIDAMHNAYKGKPAVLVAAGPSLAKNMHLLKELLGPPGGERKAVIIAVQTMLKPLLAAGIEPDFVTSLDYNTVSTRFFENLEESGATGRVHLVAEAKANWNVLDVFTGSMSLLQNDFAEKLLRNSGLPDRMGLKAGATVAHLSFYLAEFLGCEPIILVGQDLGFVDGLYYKPGTAIHETWGVELGRFNTLETKEWERIVRSRSILRKIPDIHGDPMYTEEQFFVYLQQFERDFAASRCKIIDATEGGARKQGVTVMTLRHAIDTYCTTPNPPAVTPVWKNARPDPVGGLNRVKTALAARRTAALGMKETCIATIPVLEEMLTCQNDAARMQKLFVEVDRRRSTVGEDPATFEMITFLNTIGELRRYQADLLVKTAKRDPIERQRRQLTRDIEYVKDLQVGAERLLEIIDDATLRLDRQLAAISAHLPWPREVAGQTTTAGAAT